MTLSIVSNSSPLSWGDNPIYQEEDPVIIRGLTLGLLDFSSEVTYAGESPIPAYSALRNMVHGGTDALNGPHPRTLDNGMLKFSSSVPDVDDYITLPTSEFSFPPGCKRILASVALSLPASGYGSLPAARYPMFFGRMNNTSAPNINFGLWGIVSTDGVLTSVQAAALGSVPVSATAKLATLTDGNIHVLSVAVDGESTPGKLLTRVYVDNDLVNSATNSSWDGIVPQPTNLPRIGSYPATLHSPWGGMKLGRPMLVDLTGSNKSAVDMISESVVYAHRYLVSNNVP